MKNEDSSYSGYNYVESTSALELEALKKRQQVMEQQFQYDQELARQQYQYNMLALENDRAYNSPSAQMDRLKAAGLNPLLAAQYLNNDFIKSQPLEAVGRVAAAGPLNNYAPEIRLDDVLGASMDFLTKQQSMKLRELESKRSDIKLDILQHNLMLKEKQIDLYTQLMENRINKETYDFLMQKLKDEELVEDPDGNWVPRWRLSVRGEAAADNLKIMKALAFPEEQQKKIEAYVDRHNINLANKDMIRRKLKEMIETYPERFEALKKKNNLTDEQIKFLFEKNKFWDYLKNTNVFSADGQLRSGLDDYFYSQSKIMTNKAILSSVAADNAQFNQDLGTLGRVINMLTDF